MQEHIGSFEAPAIHGRARVQLMDADTGKVVHDETKDNFVSTRMLRAMSKFANLAAFSVGGYANDQSTMMARISSSSSETVAPNAFNFAPFTGLMLSDYSAAPDANERVLKGNLVAAASRSVQGTGTARGSYNPLESSHLMSFHRFVYDFATNQANSPFQSVYTLPGIAKATGSIAQHDLSGLPTVARISPRGYAAYYGSHTDVNTGKIYIINNSSPTIRTFDSFEHLVNYSYLQGAAPESGNLSPSIGATPCIRAGRLYWLGSTSSSRPLYSAPLSNLSDVTTEMTINSSWLTANGASGDGRGITALAYIPGTDRIVLGAGSSTGATGFTIALVNPSNWTIDEKFGTGPLPSGYQLSAVDGETDYLMTSAALIRLEPNGSVTEIGTNLAVSYGYFPALGTDYLIGGSPGSSVNGLATNQFIFSRALLEEPVVKTAQQTMKITYDFTLDPL